MSSTTNGSGDDGDTEIIPGAGAKTHRNLTIVYVDHELDNPNTKSTDDEAGENIDPFNLTMVYIDHHLDGSAASDTSQGSDGSNLLATGAAVVQKQQGPFCLPPEPRIIIWELLLPRKRLMMAKAWIGHDRHIHRGNRSRLNKDCKWHFGIDDWSYDYIRHWPWPESGLQVPNILHICVESRSVALRHGHFGFNSRNGGGEAGTWWNPDLDVLVFDSSWSIFQHSWALTGLQGLEHVKSLAIDQNQAWDFGYTAGYNGNDPLTIHRKHREVLAIWFTFHGTSRRQHYILEFFPHFQRLTIFFPTIYSKLQRDYSRYGLHPTEDEYSITFQLGSDIKTGEKKLRKYRKLCMMTKGVQTTADSVFASDPFDEDVEKGPVYALKHDIDVDSLDHWMPAGHEMCMADHEEVPI